jgi:tetratricopeptide (TPR) repeat protein
MRPTSGRWRWWLLVVLLLAAGLFGGWYLWHPKPTVEPPSVNLVDADPAVAAAVNAATDEVRRSPHSAAAWGKLGKILAAHRFLDAARRCFVEAERLQPSEGRWPYFHGLTLAFSDNDGAIAQYKRAIQLGNNEPAIRLRLAETLLGQTRLDEAEEQFRWLLKKTLFAANSQLGLGRVAYQRGDLQEARTYLDQSVTDPATRKASHSLLAAIELRANDPTAAARERNLAAELPDDTEWSDPLLDEINREKVGKDARLDYAVTLVKEQRSDEALALFRELTNAYPEWDQVWLSYGRFLLENRTYPAAEQALRKVVALLPDSVGGHYYLGFSLFQRGEYQEAALHFRDAVRLKPDYAMAHYRLGHALKRQNDRAGALTAFREAVRCNPSMAGAHANLGELLAEQGNKTAAIEELRTALELNPDDATARKLLEQLLQGK